MYFRSASSTSGCSAGSSRNQRNQAQAQTKPTMPKIAKIQRQLISVSIGPTSIGVSPPPRCAPAKKIPCAVPRSVTGNQREMTFDAFGNAPASPMPKRNRIASSEI